jgi:hypothetical protein
MTWPKTRRGSAQELVQRMRHTYLPDGARFKLECFDLDEAICVLEALSDAERKHAFVTWLVFTQRQEQTLEALP